MSHEYVAMILGTAMTLETSLLIQWKLRENSPSDSRRNSAPAESCEILEPRSSEKKTPDAVETSGDTDPWDSSPRKEVDIHWHSIGLTII